MSDLTTEEHEALFQRALAQFRRREDTITTSHTIPLYLSPEQAVQLALRLLRLAGAGQEGALSEKRLAEIREVMDWYGPTGQHWQSLCDLLRSHDALSAALAFANGIISDMRTLGDGGPAAQLREYERGREGLLPLLAECRDCLGAYDRDWVRFAHTRKAILQRLDAVIDGKEPPHV